MHPWSCTAALLKPAHSTRCDWAWRLLNLFPVCPFCFADEGVVVLFLFKVPQDCGPYCSWSAVDAIERTRYLDVFFSWAICYGCPTVMWGHLSAGASRPIRDHNVKSSYAAMLFVQHKDMVKPNLSGRCYSTRKFNLCNNLFYFVWLHWSTHILHESLREAAALEKEKATTLHKYTSLKWTKICSCYCCCF